MDTISKEHRSWNMSRIRGQHTAPEILVRSILHRLGYRFRLHRRSLPGCPDVVLPNLQVAIFVHGCFWHRHPGCKFAYTPKSRPEFWRKKFAENVIRDRRAKRRLNRLGWHIVVVWECQIGDIAKLANRLLRKLSRIESAKSELSKGGRCSSLKRRLR